MSVLITEEAAKRLEEIRNFIKGGESVVVIETEDHYLNAAAFIKALKGYKQSAEMDRVTAKEPHLKAGRDIDNEFREPLALIDEKIRAIENAGREYRRKIESAAREQQRIADEAARRAREEAEKIRRDAEAEAIKAAQAARQAATEEEAAAAIQDAEQFQTMAVEAQEIVQTSVAPVIVAAIPENKRGAFNTRKSYGARLINPGLFFDHLKTATLPAKIVDAIQTYINASARAAAGAKSTIPGVEFYEA